MTARQTGTEIGARRRTAAPRHAGLAALLLLTVAAGACTSFEGRLRPEREIPELHALAQAYEREPQRATFALCADHERAAPLRVAVQEFGSGEADRLLVLVHGVLSDHRCWRYMVARLARHYDVWTVDLPGCGDSDAPSADELEPHAYSPDWLARMVLDAVRQRLAARHAPARITFVGHSLGGGTLLRALGAEPLQRQFADVLARVDGAVLLAPLDFGYGKPDPQFVEMCRLPDWKLQLARVTGLLRRAVAESTWRGTMSPDRMPREELERMFEILVDPGRWHAAQAMLRRAGPFDDEAHTDWQLSRTLTRDYRRVRVPCLILWGECDETLPAQSGDRLANELPQAWMRRVLDCKHSLPVERPTLCTEQILRFLAEDRSAWAKVDCLEEGVSAAYVAAAATEETR